MGFGLGGAADLGVFEAIFRLDMSEIKKGEAELRAFSSALTGNSREQMALSKEQARLEAQLSRERIATSKSVAQAERAAAQERIAATRQVAAEQDKVAKAMSSQRALLEGTFGAITAAAIPAAIHVRNLDLQFKNLTGSEQEAAAYLADIRDMAEDLNQPFLNLADSAAMLVPLVRQANVDLSQTMMIAQRLRLIDPTARAYDAAIAIREFLSGEYLSMTRRFELPRARLSGIIQEAGGDSQTALNLLSEYLDELGITDQTLITMGEDGRYTFESLQSNAEEFLGNAGRPLIEDFLLPLADTANQAMQAMRSLGDSIQDTPTQDILRILEGAAGIVGLGFAGKMALTTGAGMLGRFGLMGGGGAAALAGLGSRLVPLMGGIGAGFAGAGLGAQFAAATTNPELQGMETGDILQVAVTTLGVAGRELAERIDNIFTGGDMADVEEGKREAAEFFIELFGGADAVARFRGEIEDAADAVGKVFDTSLAHPFSEDVITAYGQYRGNLDAINAKEAADRADTIAEHVADSARAYADYLLEVDRENEDFREEEAERVTKHNEELADIRAEADQKQVEAYNKLYKELEQERRKHVYNLAVAAADLDAVAVANEKDRYALRVQEIQDGYQEEREQTDEQRQQRLDEERADFEDETDRRARDHETRMRRMEEDFDLEMAQAGQETNARLIAIGERAAAERAEEEFRWAQEFEQLTGHNVRMLDAYRAGLANIEAELIAWAQEQGVNVSNSLRGTGVPKYDRVNSEMASSHVASAVTPTEFTNSVITTQAYQDAISAMTGKNFVTSGPNTSPASAQHELSILKTAQAFEGMGLGFASGTDFVPRTGFYALSYGESVLNRREADAMRGGKGLGGVGEVHVHINGSTNMDEGAIAAAVRQGLVDALQEVQ